MDTRPIGVFDSGLGGVSTLRQAIKQLPHEDFFYYGDCKNAPYGCRTEADIRSLTVAAGRYIASKDVKALVIACNTATAAALPALREALPIPVIGIQPAVEEACGVPGNGRILMLATRATTKLPSYLRLHASLPRPERVVNVGCPEDIVRNVEAGVLDDDIHMALLDTVLAPFRGEQIDAIVLGCTHYPFVEPAVCAYAEKYFLGEHCIFEGGIRSVRELAQCLQSSGKTNQNGGKIAFETSGEADELLPVFRMLLRL